MSAPAEQRSARVMNRTRVSVVVPVFSNLQHLPELYQRLTKTLERRVKGYDLVFVDDASRDGSVEWLRECAGRDERVRVVEMPENRGQHRAVVEGLSTAQGDVVVVLDADLQDPPEEIPRLLQALGDDDGVVFAKRGSRFEFSDALRDELRLQTYPADDQREPHPQRHGDVLCGVQADRDTRRSACVGVSVRAASSRPHRVPAYLGPDRQGDED